MYKYIPLEAILNYIPETIKEEESSKQLMSWALQAFKMSGLNWRWDYKVAIAQVVNHKACIPDGANKIHYLPYSLVDYEEDLSTYYIGTTNNGLDEENSRLVLYQQILLDSDVFRSFLPMRFVGQNPALLSKDCLNLYCKDCAIGFSINKEMTQLTVDQEEGYVLMVYNAEIENEHGELLVPDDVDLLQGMAYYAQAQHWLNRASRHEAQAMNMYKELLQLSQVMMTKAKGRHILRNINIAKNREITFGRNNIHSVVSANRRNPRWK